MSKEEENKGLRGEGRVSADVKGITKENEQEKRKGIWCCHFCSLEGVATKSLLLQ